MLAHTPVLRDEAVRLLDPQPGTHSVDATLGAGGHAAALLERTAPDGRLLAFDLDPLAHDAARTALAGYGDRVTFIHDSFDRLTAILHELRFPQPHTVLADLGLSTLELADPARGFSFQRLDDPLDMRFDPTRGGRTAADLVSTAPTDELERLLREFGEEQSARTIARSIIEARRRQPIRTVGQLVEAVVHGVHRRRGRLHPATRTFQALRMAVNDELGALRRFLPQAVACLPPGGRLAVISFHSLEDRIVKQFFREQSRAGSLDLLTKHPATPSFAEVTTNPRSRSAKLRVAMRTTSPFTNTNPT